MAALRCPCGAFVLRPTPQQPKTACARCGSTWSRPQPLSTMHARAGYARAASLTPERRSEIAQIAARARWTRAKEAKCVS